MRQRHLVTVAAALIACGLLAVGYVGLSALTAGPIAAAEMAARRAQAAPQTEVWRLGITLEGSAAYTNTAGRLATASAAVRGLQQHSYFVFPAAADARTVASAHVNFLSRSGAPIDTVSATLVVVDYDGNILRALSAPISASAVPTGSWVTLPITVSGALTINPNEILAAHFDHGAAPDPNFDTRPAFEIVVTP